MDFQIDSLLPETAYQYRAYAKSDKGISYGSIQSFKTLPDETTY